MRYQIGERICIDHLDPADTMPKGYLTSASTDKKGDDGLQISKEYRHTSREASCGRPPETYIDSAGVNDGEIAQSNKEILRFWKEIGCYRTRLLRKGLQILKLKGGSMLLEDASNGAIDTTPLIELARESLPEEYMLLHESIKKRKTLLDQIRELLKE